VIEQRARLVHRASLAGAILACLLSLPARGATPVSPPVVEYTIEVSLDPATHQLDGKERLVWRNPSGDAVPELRFHLYLNAFKNDRSTFHREWSGQLRDDRIGTKADDWGWIDVRTLTTADGRDLRPFCAYVRPDGNDGEDETVLAVALPEPVPPHGQLVLDIGFRAKLPKIFARTGFVRDYYLAGQWFPKIGVYEPAGMRQRPAGGWNCHAFHANSEFYADFGRFDVTLTVPSAYVVGATGARVSETKQGGTTTYRYVQDNVHDFAWTADPNFLVHEFAFDPYKDIPPGWSAMAAAELGETEAAIGLKPVAVRLLLQPDHLSVRDRYVLSAKQAISFYGLWFGLYPYATLTIVDPPADGLGSGGMEYPTFITGGAFLVPIHWPFTRVRVIEGVTLHEFGHQYWYGMVGSNEFEESWLDEGLNTDAEYRAMALAYGPREAAIPGGVGFDLLSLAHAEYAALPNLDPIRRFAWSYATRSHYGVNSYDKVGLFMAQLRRDLGPKTFARAERAFFQDWSFRHPSTADFFDSFQRASGRDLSTYRRNLIDGTSRLDWSVTVARSHRHEAEEGVFDTRDGRVTITRDKGAKLPEAFDTVVVFGNIGEWPHEAKARLVFEDGTIVDRLLPAEARWVRLRTTYRSRLAWAAVDPDRENIWDRNRLNDSAVLGTGRGAADTRGRAASVKYFGWASYLVGLFTQLLWALA
jgi:hypothetical protein